MPILTFIFLIFSFNVALAKKAYTFKMKQSPLSTENVLVKAKEKEVQTHYEWLYLKNFPKEYKELFQVNPDVDENSVVLFVKSNFTVDQPITNFGKKNFRSIPYLSKLAGMNYKKTQEQDRYSLEFSPIFFKYINAEAAVHFPDDLSRYYILKNLDNSSFISHLKSFNFSSDLYQSDIIAIFTPAGYNKTQIDNISFAIITNKSMEGFIMQAKMKVMISKLNKQTKVMLNVFSSK